VSGSVASRARRRSLNRQAIAKAKPVPKHLRGLSWLERLDAADRMWMPARKLEPIRKETPEVDLRPNPAAGRSFLDALDRFKAKRAQRPSPT
jgi:hypothetical protein